MNKIIYSQELSLNKLLTDITFSSNTFTTGAIDTHHYDNYKISVVSSLPITINLKFHNKHFRSVGTAFITDTRTLVANTDVYNVDLIKGENVILEINNNGLSIGATDFIKLNVFLSTHASNINLV